MYCYCIEKSEIQKKKKKKGLLIKMAPTLKSFGLSPGFCTLGVGRYATRRGGVHDYDILRAL